MYFNMFFIFLCFLHGLVFGENKLGSSYWIRDACVEDKRQIIDLYKLTKGFYSHSFLDKDELIDQMVSHCLYDAIYRGLAFVVEDVSIENNGAILAFLCQHRSLQSSAPYHVLDQSLISVHPGFRDEMLGVRLYLHLFEVIEQDYADISRIEGCCSACYIDNIVILEHCGCVFKGCQRRMPYDLFRGVFVNELTFFWKNKRFKKKPASFCKD